MLESQKITAEVILTFGIDSFINFASNTGLTQSLLAQIFIPDALRGRAFEEIKSSERDWRLLIQGSLFKGLVDRCGAECYTPFYIRSRQGSVITGDPLIQTSECPPTPTLNTFNSSA
ncbi:hypothetical protein GCM10027202_26180 [Microvirgula curvata]